MEEERFRRNWFKPNCEPGADSGVLIQLNLAARSAGTWSRDIT
jgi:hypothetical protein